MTSFSELRRERHRVWLAELKRQIHALLAGEAGQPPEQIYLFGSRARGDWDGRSDTDLLVVATSKDDAELWVNLLLDRGLAQDVIGLDHTQCLDAAAGPSIGHLAQRGPRCQTASC